MRSFPLVLLTGLLLPATGFAAGGHHAVDDATILEPGQCGLELWAERSNLDRRQLQHAGFACHILGAEVEMNAGRETATTARTLHLHGAQLKWATALQPQLAIGLVGALGWQDQTPRLQQSFLAPLTWTPREDLALHLNVGRTLLKRAPDRTLRGAALEWQAAPAWQLLAEVFHDGQRPLTRVGLRHTQSDRVTIDLSFAKASAAGTATARVPKEGWWTLGANWSFGH